MTDTINPPTTVLIAIIAAHCANYPPLANYSTNPARLI